MKKRFYVLTMIVLILLSVLIIGGCGSKKNDPVQPTQPSEIIIEPSVTQEAPAVIIIQPSETPPPSPELTPEPTPSPTSTPKPSPSPTPKPQIPIITKSPTSETVKEGGSCSFVAKYENAIWAVWHFVSPDGSTDITYEKASKVFPYVTIKDGMYSTMYLSNITYNMNGWKVYCRYSNNSGYADTSTALITVVPTTPRTPSTLPRIAKQPVSQTVVPGGSLTFGADYENALFVVWHFVSPDSTVDLPYNDPRIQIMLPGIKITDGMYSIMKLDSIPSEANGWKVYCRYSNNYGYTDTSVATITVGNAPAPTPAPAAEYTGEFHDSIAGRGNMTVAASGDQYSVTISWANSASERNVWKFSGSIDANGVMHYSGCIKTNMKYDGTGQETTTVVYNDGTGLLEYSQTDNGYYWTSGKTEDSGKTLFVRTVYN